MQVTGSIKQSKPFLVGVSGGSGSGKTYFAKELCQILGIEDCEIVYQDNFYFDQSSRFDFDGGAVNFDHPDSIDFNFLAQSLRTLRAGQAAEIPIYNFATHSRLQETLRIEPKQIILVDGILIFHKPEIRSLFDELIFFETPEELRFQRRLDRDVHERGRTPEGVRQQFFRQVKPMHDLYVETTKRHADFIVKDLEQYKSFLADYSSKCRDLCDLFRLET